MRTIGLCVVACLAGGGCKLGQQGADAGVDAAAPTPTAEQQAAFNSGAQGIVALHRATLVADNVFKFDPDLSPAMTADQNAMAASTRVGDNLAGCGTVMLAGTTLSVDFGAAPGCTLKTGLQVSGALAATFGRPDAGTVQVSVTFTSLVVDGTSFNGSAAFATKNGSTFTFTATALTVGALTLDENLTVVGTLGGATLDGTATLAQPGKVTTQLTITGLQLRERQCYPSGGTVVITQAPSTVTLTFTASTATTGVVQLTYMIGPLSVTTPLMLPYGCTGGRALGVDGGG